MNRLLLLIFLSSYSVIYSQIDFFVFKKRDKQIALFKKDSYIACQLKNKEWITGFVTKVQNDSFYVKPFIVHYTITGPDTIHYEVKSLALTDIYAMPRQGELFNYTNDRVTMIFGNEHWVWIKNGWIFLVGSAAYATLNVTNGLLKNESTFAKPNTNRLSIAGALFFIGSLLHVTYKLVLIIRRKYHLETIKLSG